MNRLKRFMLNGILTALVAVAMRFAGLLLNIFITRKLGAAGMGLLSLINSVFGFALTFSTAGVNLAATRLCAQALARNSVRELKKALRYCIGYALLFGVLALLCLWTFADFIASKLLSAPDASLCLRLLAICMPIFSLTAALGGYFTAVRRAWKNAVSAVLEQAVKIVVVILLFSHVSPKSSAGACLLVIFSMVCAEVVSGAVTLLLYLLDLATQRGEGKGEEGVLRRLFAVAFPVALSSYIRSALVTIEHILIPRGLGKAGNPEGALATYGVVQGMAFPVIFFPTALLYAFTGLVIPEMTYAKEKREKKQIGRMTEKVLHLTLLFAIGCGGALFVFADCLGMAFYKNAEAGYYIRMMAPLIPVMYLDSATDALLKGMGEQVYTMKVNVADALFSLVMVTLLVPKMGIAGYILVVYVSEAVNLGFSLYRLYRMTDVLPRLLRSVSLPVLGVILFLPLGHPALVGFLALRMILGVFIYFLFLILSGCIGKDEKELWHKTIAKSSE